MKAYLLIFIGILSVACGKPQAYPPIGGNLSQKDLSVSRDRAKKLNEYERQQISDWIKLQPQKFYPMQMNYWVDLPHLVDRSKKQDGDVVSYQYSLYDFDVKQLYATPTVVTNEQLGKYNELKAVDDAVRYLNKGEEATLLIPSVLGFGTYGDNKKITNDMPIIVKIKML